MKTIYCGICGEKVPMLEDHEFGDYALVYNRCVQSVKDYRIETGKSLEDTPLSDLYKPTIDKYEQMTGYRGADAFHMYRKHRVSRFGEPCSKCGEYYLAPRTNQCPECGSVRGA